MSAIAALLLVNMAYAEAPATGDVEDPFSWLEGPVRCDQIKNDFHSRYGLGDPSPRKLSPVLQEELRHLKGETCENHRYAQCRFSWCGAAPVAEVASAKSAAKIQELDDAEAKILAALEDTNRSLAPSEAKEAAKKDLLPDTTARARLADTVPQRAVNTGTSERSEAVVAAAVIEEKKTPETVDFRRAAEEELRSLLRDRTDERAKIIEAKALTERSKGALWQPIKVPGADRPPKMRPAFGNDSFGASGASSAPVPTGRSRTITPGLDQPATSHLDPAAYGGVRNVPVADSSVNAGRGAYRQILDDARSARNRVASE